MKKKTRKLLSKFERVIVEVIDTEAAVRLPQNRWGHLCAGLKLIRKKAGNG